MKFTVSSSDLLKHVQVAAGALSSNPVLPPILENFLFEVADDRLTICATDLETSIFTSLPVQADEDFSVAVPAKILQDTLKALPQQPITFSVTPENRSIEITSSYGKYKVAGEDGTQFPEIPQPQNVDSVKIGSRHLQEAIAKTIFATSSDDLRPAMSGVYFEVDFNRLTCVATDAHKLVKFTTPHLAGEVATSFIVPKKALNLLKNALPNDTTAQISFNRTNAFFTFGDVLLVCRLIDARYPDYNAVIPVENPNRLTVHRSDFQNSLRRIAIFANKTTNQVILDISPNLLTLSAQDLDFSNEATEQMPCTYEGTPLRIAFNARFLIEMLSVLDSEEVRIELSTPSRAGIITPIEDANADREILMLVMPVMLNA